MIVFAMAGLSARFTAAGYDRPKYMLPLWGRAVFDHAVGGFRSRFDQEPFLFVFQDVAGTADFVAGRTAALGLAAATRVRLARPTRGQAETVALGLRRAQVDPAAPLTIFNIDTFRPGWSPLGGEAPDGRLEVFEGEGDNWSFARTAPGSDRVLEVAEKRSISRWCCTGLYEFGRVGRFLEAFDRAVDDETLRGPGGEIYVAPLYNDLLRTGGDVRIRPVARQEVVFCGVPAEYEALRGAPPPPG